jgi:predicted dehydrogenase
MAAVEKVIRVGIVGAGSNTQGRHLPELQKIEGVEIVSVANRSRESAQRVAERFGIPKVVDRWEDLVHADDTDAIVIGTWPYTHCEMTLAALDAGKHVLCEARMAMNLDEARRMLAASWARPQLVTQLVPSPMTLGVDTAIRRLLQDNFLGDLLAINIQANGSDFVAPNASLHWRQDRTKSGQNILNMGIWYEAVLRWVGEAVCVLALGKIAVPERLDAETGQPVAVTIPDHLDILAEMACGAQVHFQSSSVTGLAPAPSAWLFGSEGTLQFRLRENALYGGRRGDEELAPLPISVDERGFWRVEQEFIGAIRGGDPIRLTTFEDGVRYMAFTEAVARTLASGTAIPVPSAAI